MTVICKAIHVINYDANRIESRTIPEDFNNYIESLIANINANTSTRQFSPRSQATQVISLVRNIISDVNSEDESINTVEQKFEDIANRLLRVEVDTQEQINRLGQRIKKGSLVQALFSDNQEYTYLLAKVEHSGFIDDTDFSMKTGFSSEQVKIWKSCVLECLNLENDIIVDSAKVFLDGTAKYWHNDFLELDEMVDDESNTKKAFKSIEEVLSRRVKSTAPSDYIVLRNTIVGYLKRPQHIDYNNMINSVFDQYQPTDLTTTDISAIKNKLLELPEKKKFDHQFNSVPTAINARIRKVYKVNQGIEIKISDYIGDIKETIKSIEEPNGARYIQIRTNDDNTFDTFKTD